MPGAGFATIPGSVHPRDMRSPYADLGALLDSTRELTPEEMAELQLEQGFVEAALSIYEALLLEEPANAYYRRRCEWLARLSWAKPRPVRAVGEPPRRAVPRPRTSTRPGPQGSAPPPPGLPDPSRAGPLRRSALQGEIAPRKIVPVG